jgi:CheY-like chemotaxis protein
MQKKVLIVGKLGRYAGDERGIFARSSIRVLTAATNAEAIETHRKEHVDLIITELEAFGLKGDELCARLRSDKDLRAVSVILVTDGTPGHAARASAARANGVLVSPFAPDALAEKATQLLDVRKRQSYRVVTNIKVDGEIPPRIVVCETVNISATGFLIEADKALAQGDAITFSFFLPGMKRVTSQGEVVRVVKNGKGFQYGVRFTGLSSVDGAALDAFVKSRS